MPASNLTPTASDSPAIASILQQQRKLEDDLLRSGLTVVQRRLLNRLRRVRLSLWQFIDLPDDCNGLPV